MSIRQWVATKEVCNVIHDAEIEGRVAEAADAANNLLSNFGNGKEKVRMALVVSVIIPFLKRLLKDDYESYKQVKELL